MNASLTYKIKVAYQGTPFFGFQIQPHKATVQSHLEKSLQILLKEKIKIVPSGRTDTGVHALAQICHFEINSEMAKNQIIKKDFLIKLNNLLPLEIKGLSCVKKNGFHARRHAKQKTYEYFLLISPFAHPFLANFVWHLKKDIDLNAMKKSAQYCLGKKDFSSFCAADSTTKTKVRHLEKIEFSTKNPLPFFKLGSEKTILIRFTGKGFLKQMVRNLVGTLVEVGQGKKSVQDIQKILKAKDRRKAGITAPPQGLYLKKVSY